MIEYRVRSVSLLNLYNDILKGRLIPDAYFQRNLVWREVHKRDFIKTILLGFPFPQIFISKGKVNVETMSTVSCIVDGQQRSNAIVGFINGDFDVEGKFFSGMPENEKSDFLKYEIAVIELDLENDDPKVLEIFQRINRTSNSLTSIEKLASQFSTSEYMLVAKLLADQVSSSRSKDEEFKEDPNIPDGFYAWAGSVKTKEFHKLINEKGVFTAYEVARKVNLMHVLNVMAAMIGGFSNRNERAVEHLTDFAFNFPNKDDVVKDLNGAAAYILKCSFRAKSYWLNKANLFSLLLAVVALKRDGGLPGPEEAGRRLAQFEKVLPEDYRLAATEAVNSTRARQLRHRYLIEVLGA